MIIVIKQQLPEPVILLRYKKYLLCFEADVMTDMANWQCVLVFGKFEELDEKKSQEARHILFGRVFSLMTSSTIHAHEHPVTDTPDDSNRIKPVMYRIKIDKMTGRYESAI